MRRTGSEQHFFTVRGRGFDLKQWSRILAIVEEIVDRAKKAGLAATFDGNARNLKVGAPGAQELLVVRKGEPGIPKQIATEGLYDVLIQTVLAAIKKIAPDIFVMTSPDGRDYRRLFANADAAPGHGSWGRMKRMDQLPKTKEEAFLKAMGKQKWRHPETSNQVEFVSLPKREQSKLRRRWEQEFGDRYQRALEKARAEADEAKKEVGEADDAQEDLKREKQKAEKARGLEDAFEEALKTAETSVEEKATTMNEDIIRRAAIRVAAKTENKDLKHELLTILRATTQKGATHHEKETRHEEGKAIDVGTWLKQNGYDEAAAKWEKHEGQVAKKASPAVVFPDVHDLAWRHILSYAKSNPDSKVAKGATAHRVSAATHVAKKWIQDAIERPGRVHEYLGVPEDKDIPMGKLEAAIEKVKGSGNKSLLSALLLAKRLKGMGKKKAADDVWLNRESFEKAATEVWGAEHMAKDWIQAAVQQPGRVREYLGVPLGENIPATKLDDAIKTVQASGSPRDLLASLLLAKRLKKMHAKQAAQAA